MEKLLSKEAALQLVSLSISISELFIYDTVHSSFFLLSFNYEFQGLWRYGLKPALMYERQFLRFVSLFFAFLFSLGLLPLIPPSFRITDVNVQRLIRFLRGFVKMQRLRNMRHVPRLCQLLNNIRLFVPLYHMVFLHLLMHSINRRKPFILRLRKPLLPSFLIPWRRGATLVYTHVLGSWHLWVNLCLTVVV